MASVIVKLNIDLSGRDPNNLVSNEEHLLLLAGSTPYPVIAMNNGGFYTRGLIVLDSTGRILKPNVDYVAEYKYPVASANTGLEICGSLVILNTTLTGSVYVTAQMVGGDYAFSLSAREDTIAWLETLNGATPTWAAYIGAEAAWLEGQLNAERWSLQGYQRFVEKLDEITTLVYGAWPQNEADFRQAVKQKVQDFIGSTNGGLDAHLQDHNDPHDVKKDQIGLGLVENYPLADSPTAIAGLSDTSYLTPYTFSLEVDAKTTAPLNAHVSDDANPHVDTTVNIGCYNKAQVNGYLAQLLDKGATAGNTAALMDGSGNDISFALAASKLVGDVPAQNVISGLFPAIRVAKGTPSYDTVLTSDGRWTPINQVSSLFNRPVTFKILWLGTHLDNNTALASVISTYADVSTYPVGSIALWRTDDREMVGSGNGVTYYTFKSLRGAYRKSSGWVLM